MGLLREVGLLPVFLLACPLAILFVGTHVVLFVRMLIEIAERM